MAYSRFTLNKQEKQTIGALLILALVHFLNQTFPRLAMFWTRTLGQSAETVSNVGETVSTVAIGYAILKVSKVLPGYGRLAGMVLGYGLILASLIPLFMQGRSLSDVLGGSGNGQVNG
jgi:hypothetical protein